MFFVCIHEHEHGTIAQGKEPMKRCTPRRCLGDVSLPIQKFGRCRYPGNRLVRRFGFLFGCVEIACSIRRDQLIIDPYLDLLRSQGLWRGHRQKSDRHTEPTSRKSFHNPGFVWRIAYCSGFLLQGNHVKSVPHITVS